MSNGDRLSWGIVIAFMLPGLMAGFMHSPTESLVQGIYAKHAGLALTAIAAGVVLTRIFDLITSPLVGYPSALPARRTGSRKPWIAAGTACSVIGLWFLYRPPAGVTIVYF